MISINLIKFGIWYEYNEKIAIVLSLDSKKDFSIKIYCFRITNQKFKAGERVKM